MAHTQDQFNEEYYRGNGQLGDRPALRYYARLVRRYVGAGPYLDYGCGTGHLVRRLSSLGEASGFEISTYSASQARVNAPGCRIYTDDAEIPDASVAGITSIHVLEHLADDIVEQVLATWRRILRPGGRVLAVMPDPAGRASVMAGEGWIGYADTTHINLKPHAEWAAVLAGHGLRVLREGSDGMWNVPYGRLPKLVDAALRAGPALAQFLSGRLFLRPGSGESSIFVLASDN
ncbi:MAG: class I SAM-dependent methyltransferase [Labedaea sp.]